MIQTLNDSTIVKDSLLKIQELNRVVIDSIKIDSLEDILYKKSKALDSITSLLDSLNNTETTQAPVTESLWGMPVATAAIVISSLITISIFIIGFFLNWLNKKFEKKSEFESIKSVVTVWVDLLKSPILQQAQGSRNFAITLRNSPDIHPERLSYNKLLANKLNSIELRELIQVFIINSKGEENEKSKNLFNLVSQVDYLIQVEEKIPEAYSIFQSRTFQLMENWNQRFKELDLLKSQMTSIMANNQTHPTFPLFQQFNNIGHAYVQQFPNGSSVVETKTTLLEPLEIQVSQFINQHPNDQIAHQLAGKIQELNMIYREWQVHFEGNATVFYDFAIRLVSVYKTLFKATNQLKSREFKNVWELN